MITTGILLLLLACFTNMAVIHFPKLYFTCYVTLVHYNLELRGIFFHINPESYGILSLLVHIQDIDSTSILLFGSIRISSIFALPEITGFEKLLIQKSLPFKKCWFFEATFWKLTGKLTEILERGKTYHYVPRISSLNHPESVKLVKIKNLETMEYVSSWKGG